MDWTAWARVEDYASAVRKILTVAWLDPILIFEDHVGVEHSRDTNLHLRTQLPYRRKALAGVQRALVDKLGDVIRDSLVEQFLASSFLFNHAQILTFPSLFWQIQQPRQTTSTVGKQ